MVLDRLALNRGAVDRAAHRRTDPEWLSAATADPRSRVLAVADGRVLITGGDPPALLLLPPARAPEGERYLLGVAHEVAYFAARLPALPEGPAAGLREVGALLPDLDAGLAVTAIALANWHAAHPHCSRCGAPTEVTDAGFVRRCARDGSSHFPRTDPAVIMAVVDADGRVLLGRQERWPPRRFSTLAGFVEPGESLEDAVRREVAEETGVRVGEATYLGSQPWPFPSSLMLGFRAQAETTEIAVDGEELSEAGWWSRSELAGALAAGELLLPPRVSIARRLIEHWYGGELPGP